MAKRPPRTVLEWCVAKRGVHRGAIAAANFAQFVMTTRELGHVPTIAVYADWWALDERTGWRHAARVEAVFGDDWRRVVEAVAAEVDRRMSPRELQGLPVPVLA